MKRGKIIKQRRLELGLSQRKLAKKAGVSNPFICQIEKDDRSFSINILIKLSQALNLPINKILFQETGIDWEPDKKPQIDRIEDKISIILNRTKCCCNCRGDDCSESILTMKI